MLLTTPRSYRTHAFTAAAQKLGIEVVRVIDMPPQLAEYWNYPLGVEFNDLDTAVEAIAAYVNNTPVDAILAVDDVGTLLAARASEVLGLPHNDYASAEAARDKFRMRSLLAKAGVPCPRFQRFSTADDPAEVAAQAPYPCVVKPLNLNGSRGVIRANNPQEFMAAVGRLTRLIAPQAGDADDQRPPAPYLVEEFIPGIEVALEGILDHGRLHVLALFDKPDPLDGPFFEETIYVTPSRLPRAVQEEIFACAANAAAALGLREGPLHGELRVNERGPWIVEVAGRSIGGMCSQTLRFGTDSSLEELILRQMCNLGIESLRREERAGGVMMIPIPEAGILRGVEGIEEAKAVPGIEDIQITARTNYPIIPLPEGDSYLGFIFARGNSPEFVEEALREAHKKLDIQIEVEIPLWTS
jgi:biotin carboxylase